MLADEFGRVCAGVVCDSASDFLTIRSDDRNHVAGFDGVRGLWTGYVALRDVNAENESLRRELQTLQVKLQEERAQAQLELAGLAQECSPLPWTMQTVG
jgi:hypothetical protein